MAVTRPLRIGVSTYSFWHFKGEPIDIKRWLLRHERALD